MSITRNDNFRIRAPKPIDSRSTEPTLADALVNIPTQYRYQGLSVFVEDEQTEYWFRDGIEDSDLVIKISPATGSGSIKNDEYENQGISTLPSRTNRLYGQAFTVVDNVDENATEIADTIFASFVDDSVTTTSNVGGIDAGTLASDLKGRSVTDILNAIFFPVVLPTYTLPTLSVSGTGSTNVERGVQISRAITSTFAQNDYGQGSNYILTFEGSTVDDDGGPFTGTTVVGGNPFNLVVVLSSTVGNISSLNATINYADAPAKDDNFGNPDPNPPSGGTLAKATNYVSRAPIWWASYRLDEVPESGGAPVIDESIIKGDFASKQLDTGGEKTYVLTPAAGDNWMIAFCPPGNNVTSAKDEDNNIPFDSMVTDFVNVNVTNGQNQAGTEISYNVHYFLSPGGFSGAQNVTIKVN